MHKIAGVAIMLLVVTAGCKILAESSRNVCLVPLVEGNTWKKAHEKVDAVGLMVVPIYENTQEREGIVIAQKPAFGTLLNPCQGVVTLTVSLGPHPLTSPYDLTPTALSAPTSSPLPTATKGDPIEDEDEEIENAEEERENAPSPQATTTRGPGPTATPQRSSFEECEACPQECLGVPSLDRVETCHNCADECFQRGREDLTVPPVPRITEVPIPPGLPFP